MARGYPDWGVQATAISSYETDLAEVAARLGSPYTFTRRGKVLFFDTFSTGIYHWISILTGTGSSIISLLTTGFHRPGSLRMISGTPVATASAVLSKRFPDISNSKYGIEILTWLTDTNDQMEIAFFRYTGALLLNFRLRINLVNDKLEAIASDGTWTALADLGVISLTTESWNLLKLVVDMAALTYVSARFNGTLITSGFPAPVSVVNTTDPARVEVRLQKTNTVTSAKAAYVSSLVVTADEP